jgi:PKD repeat protein
MQRFTFRATSREGDSISCPKILESPPRLVGSTAHLLSLAGIQRVLGQICCLVLLGSLSIASAASVELDWDRNPEPNVVEYELRYGTELGDYTKSVDAGNNTRATVSNLKEGETYHFVVVARNKAGRTSPKSAPVTYRIPERADPTPKGIIKSPNSTVTIKAGEAVSFAGDGSDPRDKTPLTYRWSFGRQSGIPESTERDPGSQIFNEPGTYTVTFTVTNSLGVSDPTPAETTIIVETPGSAPIPQNLWKLKYVDSQEATGYSATNAFDGNPGTFWHTQFTQPAVFTEPHEIQIDMGKTNMVSGFVYLSRQDGFNVGNIGKYKFYVSRDGKNWGDPVASGTFDSSAARKKVHFKPKKGRYVRLRSITEVNGYSHSNVAELNVLQPARARSTAPSSLSEPVAHAANAPVAGSAVLSAATPGFAKATLSSPPSVTTEVIGGKKYLSLTLSKPLAADKKPTVEVSPNLMDWFSGGNHTTVITDDEFILKVRDNKPVTRQEKRYIRLKEIPR